MSEKTTSQFLDVPKEKLPTGNRPTSFDDLDYFSRKPDGLFEMPDRVAEDSKLLSLWGALVNEAKYMPDRVRVEGGAIVLLNTPEEVERKIEKAARKYDEALDVFYRHVNGISHAEYGFNVSDYINAEGIKWEADWQHPSLISDE